MTVPLTVGGALDVARRRLREAGIEDANREARLLLGHATGLDAATIIGYPDRYLTPEDASAMTAVVTDRARRRPMAQVIGSREFWSLPFRVTEATLDPRPDSESVIHAVLDQVRDRTARYRVLDLGTGTGCLLLAVLRELPNATGMGTDISADAIAVAAWNADRLDLRNRARFSVGEWDRALSGRFDIIVSNPPYIPTDDIDRLAPEISHFEPRQALDGGEDGLAAYRALSTALAKLMAEDGFAAIEIGSGQRAPVESIFRRAGLSATSVVDDLAGISRCLVVRINTELTVRT